MIGSEADFARSSGEIHHVFKNARILLGITAHELQFKNTWTFVSKTLTSTVQQVENVIAFGGT